MKTKNLLLLVISFLAGVYQLTAQTIAVANFNTNGVHASPEIAAKLARLELTKINQYVVMDESDMEELLPENAQVNCYGKKCLIELGKTLNTPYVLSGSIDGLGNKIVITLKLIDVNGATVKASEFMEFEHQEAELQRMIGIIIQQMHDITPDLETSKRLAYKDELILSNNVGKINNNGPRMGIAFVTSNNLNEFYTRKESQGGLDILPLTTNLGYQIEGQYIGTENFSALAEFIFNVGGMEQGQFIPSLSILNGFRFGKQGWEFAFGPSFGIKRTSMGSFDENGNYLTKREQNDIYYEEWKKNPENYDPVTNKFLKSYEGLSPSLFSEHLDKRGTFSFNANWLVGVGRTFKAGALNIPVNLYYSYGRFGGMLGANVGFNITKSKSNINP